MSDLTAGTGDRPTPPLGDEQPDGGGSCTFGADPNLCGKPATWHIIWTPDGENGLACDEHAEYARAHFVNYDRHLFGGVCCMPGSFVVWSWDRPPGLCIWQIGDPELVEAANADTKETASV